jgi:hypothetical protein
MINGVITPFVGTPFPLYTAKMKIALSNVPGDIVVFEYEAEVKAILLEND